MRAAVIRDVRALVTGGAGPTVVLLPGLGAPWYLRRLVRELERRGRRAALLDLPGHGRPAPLRCRPDVRAVGVRAAHWAVEEPEPVVLFGHSTGAQAALWAARSLQDLGRPAAGLVLTGPTPAPAQRSVPRLLLRVPLALRRESPAELGQLAALLRAPAGPWRLLRSAVRDRPELTRAGLAVPVVVTAGRADSFAPPAWLAELAGSDGRVVLGPGSHNNPFTHPAEVADVIGGLPRSGRPTGTPDAHAR